MSSTAIGAHCGAELELWLQLIGEENPGRCLPFTGEKNTVLKKFAVISGEIQATKCGAGQQPQWGGLPWRMMFLWLFFSREIPLRHFGTTVSSVELWMWRRGIFRHRLLQGIAWIRSNRASGWAFVIQKQFLWRDTKHRRWGWCCVLQRWRWEERSVGRAVWVAERQSWVLAVLRGGHGL